MGSTIWVDASAGIAGDMLAGALVDAGVPMRVLQDAVAAVLPDAARLTSTDVIRAGLRATKFSVEVEEQGSPHRHLSDIRARIDAAQISASVRERSIAVFERLGAVEAAAHGVDIEQVHFHEVGAIDSIADIVAVCAAVDWLEADELLFSDIAVGSGTVQTEHGVLAVPTPAVLRLAQGLRIAAVGSGELATPTGVALLTTLGRQGEMPSLRVQRSGSGAGSKDFPNRANVVRVIVGDALARTDTVVIEANIDDMDPRLWPAAIEALMRAGASDAWLTPIVMKKGRPAQTVSVLCSRDHVDAVMDTLFRETTTIGARVVDVDKLALDRGFAEVDVDGHRIGVKLAGRAGHIYNVSVEFEDVARAARALARTQRDVLDAATAAAARSGYAVGSAFAFD